MKDEKPVRQVSKEQIKAVRTGGTEQGMMGTESTVRSELQPRKGRGRLSREDQRRLGDILQRVYDDVVKEGVPDRFVKLINQIDQPSQGPGNSGEELARGEVNRTSSPETT
jgi:hypothetical protein